MEVLREYRNRQAARTGFLEWCIQAGYKPAKHHRLLIAELQALVDKLIETLNNLSPEQREMEVDGLRLMVLMPPGSAKSTYVSKLFPPWFLAQVSRLPTRDLGILACSHSADLATEFGSAARNLVVNNERWLGYRLDPAKRANDLWQTTTNGYYKAAGVGSGIAGRRMHLGLIDDFCGSQEEAMSQTFNDKTWNWYVNDFVVRLQPFAARVIIANHRNEDDLVGRLLAREPEKWKIVRLRLLIESEEQSSEDPLGRSIGDYLWPEYFTRQQVVERMGNPYASGIEQQEPSPLKGAFFNEEMFIGYELKDLPKRDECQAYAASDHAVRTKEANDNTCMGIGYWRDNVLYIHPDLVWDRIPTNKAVKQMLRLGKEHTPIQWWAEKENISGSIGPFLKDQMEETGIWISVIEVPHMNKDLMSRCQPIHALMSMGRVRFPTFAPWFQRFKREVLNFPNGKHDDSVSFLAHLGRGVNLMLSPSKPGAEPNGPLDKPAPVMTLAWLKKAAKAALSQARYADR